MDDRGVVVRFLRGKKESVFLLQDVPIMSGAYPAYNQMVSSSSLSCNYHGGGLPVGPFWSHTSRSLFNGLPWFLLPFGLLFFLFLGNLL